MSESLNILIACGGTGGHLFPGIAVAQQLQQAGHKPLLLVSQKKIDAVARGKYGEFEFIEVPAIGMPALFSLQLPVFGFKMIKALRQAKKILEERKIDVMLGMGGFTSLAPLIVARGMGLATFVHDSNALPGKANRIASRWCRKVLLGFSDAAQYIAHAPCVLTGTPVRREFADKKLSRSSAFKALGLRFDITKNLVLVTGGSQGARTLNSICVEAAAQPQCKNTNFLMLTGPLDFERVSELAKDLPNVQVMEFCNDMVAAYSASNLAITRSGASTLCELAHFGVPSILVPLPTAADNHQLINAQVYAVAGAALVLEQGGLDASKLSTQVAELLANTRKLTTMQAAARQQASPDAARRISNEITNLGQ